MLELDGVARRLVLCTPDLPPQHLPGVISGAEADCCVRDEGSAAAAEIGLPAITLQPTLSAGGRQRAAAPLATEWILLTSGTTGAPKLVLHTLASLTSALAGQPPPPEPLTGEAIAPYLADLGRRVPLRAGQPLRAGLPDAAARSARRGRARSPAAST